MHRGLAIALLGVLCAGGAVAAPGERPAGNGPRSTPVASEGADRGANKFLDRSPVSIEDYVFGTDASAHHHVDERCPIDIDLRWSAELGASVYATPLVYPLFRDGTKQIVAATFTHDIEVIDFDGSRPAGWPVSFEGSQFHASPLLHDVNRDGIQDILAVDSDGRVVWVVVDDNDEFSGEQELIVPRLAVRKDWHVGLDPARIDEEVALSSFVHDAKAGKAAADARAAQELAARAPADGPAPEGAAPRLPSTRGVPAADSVHAHVARRQGDPVRAGLAEMAAGGAGSRRRLLQRPRNRGDAARAAAANAAGNGRASFESVRGDASEDARFFVRRPGTVQGESRGDPEMVLLDAHVLATPVIADLEGDGQHELVLAVSYFFDREQYPRPEDWARVLGEGVDPRKYVAGGVVCYDIDAEKWRWTAHLDLTTDEGAHRAYIYSAPAVADVDGDGRMEIALGTSLGLVYVLDAAGETRAGWPVQVAEVQGQVALADVAGDAALEVVVADMRGNVVVLDCDGREVWERQLPGQAAQGPVVGDVNGDGTPDVVVATSTGQVFALDGATGRDLPGWPVRSGGKVLAVPTLVSLHRDVVPGTVVPAAAAGATAREKEAAEAAGAAAGAEASAAGAAGAGASAGRVRRGLHVVFPSFDGHVYVVDGETGCANKVDVGEHAYASVLADDVTGDGTLDLLVTTMNGNAHLFSTGVPHHPLNTWTSAGQGRSQLQARVGWQGIAVTAETRAFREVFSTTVVVGVEITDERANVADGEARYRVQVGTSSDHPLATLETTAPGRYDLVVELRTPQYATLLISMVNEHGQYFEDAFSVAANVHFYRIFKWVALAPLATALALVGGARLLGSSSRGDALLPSAR